ncbi:unnamed protein product, partial [Closterium sp. NIES-54]
RPWLVFWIVHSLALLEHPLDASLAARCADTLRRCQHPEGGFGGGPGQLAHLATTYAAVAALVTVGGEEALSVVNRKTMLAFLRRMKCQSGGFRLHQGGETDVRGCYTAMAVAHLLCIRTPDLTENVAAYVHRCQTYEGGIGGEPGAEAHGGYTFCGLAAVLLAGADPWEHLNLPLLLDWLVFRQGSVEGGFQGRSNKLVDACYSLWQGGLFPLLALCSPPCLPNGDASSAQQPNNVSLSPRSDCISGDQQAVQAGSGEGRGVAGESGGVAGDSVQEGRGAEGCSSGSEGGGGDQRGGDGAEDEEADEDENEEEDEEDEWEEADVESFHRVPLAAAADLFPCPESLLPPAGAGEGGERTGGKRGGGEESGGEGEEGREGAADAVGGESGDRATARGGRDCVGSFCYSDVALQAYLLLCCQVRSVPHHTSSNLPPRHTSSNLPPRHTSPSPLASRLTNSGIRLFPAFLSCQAFTFLHHHHGPHAIPRNITMVPMPFLATSSWSPCHSSQHHHGPHAIPCNITKVPMPFLATSPRSPCHSSQHHQGPHAIPRNITKVPMPFLATSPRSPCHSSQHHQGPHAIPRNITKVPMPFLATSSRSPCHSSQHHHGPPCNSLLLSLRLPCLQVPEGGLRDKPGKARDYYHTCYALSGLTAAQHSHPVTLPHTHAPQQAAASMAQGVGGSVLGPVSNLLAVAEPRCNRNFSFSASLRTQKCFDASVLNSRLVLLQAKSNLLSSARSSLRSSKSACMRGLPSSGRLLIATLTRSIQSHRAQSPCAPHSSFLQSAPKVVWALFPGGALGSPRALGAAHVSELGRQVISARGLTSAQAAPRMGDKRKANGEGVAENKKSKAAVAVEEGSAGAGGAAGGGGEVMGGPSGFKVLKEGAAEILVQGNDVFYNKAQVVNRDLSVCVLRALVTVRREEENQRAAAVVAGVKGRALLKHLNADLAAKSAAAAAAKLRGGEKGGGAEKGEGGEKGEVGDRKGEDKEVLEGEGRAAEGAAGGEAGERKEKSGEEGDGAAAMIEGAEAGEGQQQQQQQLAKVAEVKPLRILEGLAASGLRSIRYAKEIPGVGTVVALDNDPVAVQACQRNVAHNFGGAPPPAATASDAAVAAEGEGGEGKEEGKGGEGKPASEEGKGEGEAAVPVRAEQGDARVYMIVHEKQFDAVDLDPYGTPSVFLDGAVQAVADGGMLLVTATDMAVLCGNNAEVCYSKYGAYPHRAKYCHEMAIRILLASIESAANRFKRHIVPVLSVSVDFYIRVFVRVFTSAQAVKATPSKLAYVFQCSGCDSYHLQPVGRVVEGRTKKPDAPPPPPRYLPGLGPVIPPACEHCGRHLSIGGPMWSAPIHDASWVRLVLGEVQAGKARLAGFGKVHGLLTAVSEELHDIPLYLDLHEISATLKCTPPSMLLFRSALVNAGHRVSGAHSNPLGIKTDAPLGLVWDVMRCWIRDHPVKSQGEGSPADTILAKPPTTE